MTTTRRTFLAASVAAAAATTSAARAFADPSASPSPSTTPTGTPSPSVTPTPTSTPTRSSATPTPTTSGTPSADPSQSSTSAESRAVQENYPTHPRFNMLATPWLASLTPDPMGYTAPSGEVIGDDGVPRSRLKGAGDGLHVHATRVGNFVLYHSSRGAAGSRQSLTLAANALQGTWNLSTPYQNARFVPYDFQWDAGYYGSVPNPWYSAFGQSKFPRAARLVYQATGDRRFLEMEQGFFNAFGVLPSGAKPWVAGVDRSTNALWLEEYPCRGQLSEVFNGHIYATQELLRYHELTGNRRALEYVRGALWSAWRYRNQCRHPGTFSRYYNRVRADVPSYHAINTGCYVVLYRLTGHRDFGTIIDGLLDDWVIDQRPGTFHALPNLTHTVRSSSGAVSSWRPTERVVGSFSTRRSFKGADAWLLMTSGPRRGYWLKEASMAAYSEGYDTNSIDLHVPLKIGVRPNYAVPGYAFSRNGTRYQRATGRWSRTSRARVSRSAVIAGKRHWWFVDGMFKNLWVPANYLDFS